MLFYDISVSDTLKRQLLNTFVQKRIAHARLFLGSEGSAALPLALAYARLLLCRQPSENDACGTCNSCQKTEKLIHPDLHLVFPLVKPASGVVLSSMFLENFRKLFSGNPLLTPADWLDEIASGENKQAAILDAEGKNIAKEAFRKSFEGGYKIFIVWQAEKMNVTVANKLLKLLEEPPEKTLFLLIAASTDQMLSTVLSRVQVTEVPMADSIDSEESRRFFDKFVVLMRLCWSVRSTNKQTQNDAVQQLLALSDTLAGWQRAVIKRFLLFSIRMVRENLMLNLEQPQLARLSPHEEEFSVKFSQFIRPDNAPLLVAEFEKAYRDVDGNVSERLVMVDMSMEIVRIIRV